MLVMDKKTHRGRISKVVPVLGLLILASGLYVLSLTFAPSVAPLIVRKPITVSALPIPSKSEDRIIIPKLGVNIHYAPGAQSLDRGAEWRHPERGNPVKGGNFIIAAHRFSIQPTPQGTIEKSPFYSIDKLVVGDKIIIDYQGTRYAYGIEELFTVQPSQTEVEAASDTPKLTLYSCELNGSSAGRVVVVATPLGKVDLGDRTTEAN